MDDIWVIVWTLHGIGSQAGKWLSSHGARPKLRIVSKHMGREGGKYLLPVPYTAPVQKKIFVRGKLDLFPLFHPDMAHPFGRGVSTSQLKRHMEQVRTVDNCCLHLCFWGLLLDFQIFQWSDRRVTSVLEMAGGGHSGLGRCRPSISGVSCGLWVALVGVQSPREAWAALRWAKRWVIEKPAFPSSCDSTTSTCLQREVKSKRRALSTRAFRAFWKSVKICFLRIVENKRL